MDFKTYEKKALSTAIYPGMGTHLGLVYVALKMNGEAGEFAEHLGKAIRDDDLMPLGMVYTNTEAEKTGDIFGEVNSLTPERRNLLIKEIGDVLWYLNAAAVELGTSLNNVAVMNIEKLANRAKEGKISGSGDDR